MPLTINTLYEQLRENKLRDLVKSYETNPIKLNDYFKNAHDIVQLIVYIQPRNRRNQLVNLIAIAIGLDNDKAIALLSNYGILLGESLRKSHFVNAQHVVTAAAAAAMSNSRKYLKMARFFTNNGVKFDRRCSFPAGHNLHIKSGNHVKNIFRITKDTAINNLLLKPQHPLMIYYKRIHQENQNMIKAVKANNLHALQLAIKRGAQIKNLAFYSELFVLASELSHVAILKWLTQTAGVNTINGLLAYCQNKKTTPITACVKNPGVSELDKIKTIKWLLHYGINTQQTDDKGKTAAQHAQALRLTQVGKLLEEQTAFNRKLNEAIQTSNIQAVHDSIGNRYFPKAQIYFYSLDNKVKSPVQLAVDLGKADIARLLIEEYQAPLNLPNSNARSVLITAADKGLLSLVKFLVKKAYVIVNESLKKAIDKTLSGRHPDISRYVSGVLKRNHELIAIMNNQKLTENQKLKKIESLQTEGMQLEYFATRKQFTAFHIAAAKGHVKLLQYFFSINPQLLERRAFHGETPLIVAAANGQIGAIQWLYVKGANPYIKRKDGSTALHEAAFYGHEAVVKWCVHIGLSASSVNLYSETPKKSCQQSGDTFQRVRAYLATVENANSRLIEATKASNLSAVKLAIAQGAQVNATDQAGNTPLMVAASRNNADILLYLLRVGSDIHHRNEDKQTVLHKAVLAKHKKNVHCLLRHHADIDAIDNNGYKPEALTAIPQEIKNLLSLQRKLNKQLHDAILRKDLGGVKKSVLDDKTTGLRASIMYCDEVYKQHSFLKAALLSSLEVLQYLDSWAKRTLTDTAYRTYIHHRDIYGNNALLTTMIKQKNTRIIAYLLKKGFSYTAPNHQGLSAKVIAELNEENTPDKQLLKEVVENTKNLEECLDRECKEQEIKKYLVHQAQYNKRYQYGKNIILSAIEKKRFEFAAYLLKHYPIDINHIDAAGRNILFYAIAAQCSIEMLDNLTQLNEKRKQENSPYFTLNHQDKLGNTVLHYIVYSESTPSTALVSQQRKAYVDWLLKKGINPEISNFAGEIPLTIATLSANNQSEAVALLKEVSSNNAEIATLLRQGNINKFFERVEEKQHHLWLGTKDSEGNTLLHLSALMDLGIFDRSDYLSLIDILKKRGLSFNQLNHHGQTPAMYAAIHGKLINLKIFVENYKSLIIDRQDFKGKTAKDYAVENQHKTVQEYLDDVKTHRGKLKEAVKNNEINKFNRLMSELPLNIDIRDDQGNTLLQIAATKGHNVLFDRILNHYHADISAVNIQGEDALILAVKYKHVKIVKCLLDKNPRLLTYQPLQGPSAIQWSEINKNVVPCPSCKEIHNYIKNVVEKMESGSHEFDIQLTVDRVYHEIAENHIGGALDIVNKKISSYPASIKLVYLSAKLNMLMANKSKSTSIKQRKYNKAIDTLRTFLDKHTNIDDSFYNLLAGIQFTLKQYEEARKTLLKLPYIKAITQNSEENENTVEILQRHFDTQWRLQSTLEEENIYLHSIIGQYMMILLHLDHIDELAVLHKYVFKDNPMGAYLSDKLYDQRNQFYQLLLDKATEIMRQSTQKAYDFLGKILSNDINLSSKASLQERFGDLTFKLLKNATKEKQIILFKKVEAAYKKAMASSSDTNHHARLSEKLMKLNKEKPMSYQKYLEAKNNIESDVSYDGATSPDIKEVGYGNRKLHAKNMGWKLIHFSAWFGDLEFIKEMFNSDSIKAPTLFDTRNDWTLAHIACFSSEVKSNILIPLLKELHEHAIPLDTKTDKGENIFHLLIRSNKELSLIKGIIKEFPALLSLLFDKNTNDTTPKNLANSYGKTDITAFIKHQAFLRVVRDDNIDRYIEMVQADESLAIRAKDVHGDSAIHVALLNRSHQILDKLLDKPNVIQLLNRPNDNNRILHRITQKGLTHTIKLFIEKLEKKHALSVFEKQLKQLDEEKNAPIHIALIHGHFTLVNLFFAKFETISLELASTHRKNALGLTISQLMARYGYFDKPIYLKLSDAGYLLPELDPQLSVFNTHPALLSITHNNHRAISFYFEQPVIKTNDELLLAAITKTLHYSINFKFFDDLLILAKKRGIFSDYTKLLMDIVNDHRIDVLEYVLLNSVHKEKFREAANNHYNQFHTPYTRSVSLGYDEITTLFLKHKIVNVNQKANKVPAIFWPIKEGFKSTVQLLCHYGAVVTSVENLPGSFTGSKSVKRSAVAYASDVHEAINNAVSEERANALAISNILEKYQVNPKVIGNDAIGYTRIPNSIAIQGGGEKGFCYIGAYKVLHQCNLINHIQYISGTSIGAIFGTLMALRMTPEKMEKEFLNMNFLDFILPNREPTSLKDKLNSWKEFAKRLGGSNAIEMILNLGKFLTSSERTGLSENHQLRDFIDEKITSITGIRHMTFGDLDDAIKAGKPYSHLYLVVTNYSTGKANVFTSDQHYGSDKHRVIFDRNVVIADAAAASGSFPLIFKVAKIRKKEFTRKGTYKLTNVEGSFGDGGMLLNFPYKIFNRKRFIPGFEKSQQRNDLINNPYVLGLKFAPNQDLQNKQNPKTLLGLANAIKSVYMGHEEALEEIEDNILAMIKKNTIAITSPVGTFNFPFTLTKKKIQEAIKAGESPARSYFNDKLYSPESNIRCEMIIKVDWQGQGPGVNAKSIPFTPTLEVVDSDLQNKEQKKFTKVTSRTSKHPQVTSQANSLSPPAIFRYVHTLVRATWKLISPQEKLVTPSNMSTQQKFTKTTVALNTRQKSQTYNALIPIIPKTTTHSYPSSLNGYCVSTTVNGVPAMQCQQSNTTSYLFMKQPHDNVVVSIDNPSVIQMNDRLDRERCKPIGFYGYSSVYCEGNYTSMVTIPQFKPAPLQNMGGQIMLFQVGIQLLKQGLNILQQKRTRKKIRLNQRQVSNIQKTTAIKAMRQQLEAIQTQYEKLTTNKIPSELTWVPFSLDEHQLSLNELANKSAIIKEELEEMRLEIQTFINEFKQDYRLAQQKEPSLTNVTNSKHGFFKLHKSVNLTKHPSLNTQANSLMIISNNDKHSNQLDISTSNRIT